MRRRAPWVALLGLVAACGGGEQAVSGDLVDRETFIATYVDLRNAALLSDDFQVAADQRAEILSRHGVDGEGLVRFAEAHGRDMEFMNAVWSEVEARLAETPEP
jgi:hypothetical protein